MRGFVIWYWRHRFALLFAFLLTAIAVQPLLHQLADRSGLRVFSVGTLVLNAVVATALVAGVIGLVRERARRALLAVGVTALVGRAAGAAMGSLAVESAGETAWLVVCLLGILASLRRALGAGKVDKERIFAALDAYLLTGLAFAAAYWTLEKTWPESFGAAEAIDLTRVDAVYFSFVTLATLGYGDISPVGQSARGFAVVEAIAGQTYLAVLVARLVSLYGADDSRAD